MSWFWATTLFCEDIRRETQGSESLIGVMLDNVAVDVVPSMLPKLGLYTRVNFDIERSPKAVRVILRYPSGKEDTLTTMESDLIQSAKSKDAPLAGLISRSVFVPFHITELGRHIAMVRIDDDEIISGSLNVQLESDQG